MPTKFTRSPKNETIINSLVFCRTTGFHNLPTASKMILPDIPINKVPFVKPAKISKFFNPNGNFPFGFIAFFSNMPAIKPNANDVQSSAICKESDNNPSDLDLKE
ncbi:unnamed protein product [Debaryomyces fabryi]|nr:unnamed protein product [Debaryomyces fabryi]